MSLPGSRILPNPPLAAAEVLEAFAQVVTPHISDNLGRHIGARGLTRYNRSGKLVGTAPVSYTHLTLPTNREV